MKKIIGLFFLLPMVAYGQSQFDLYARPGKIVSSNYTLNLFDVFIVVNTNSQNDTIQLPSAASAYDANNSRGLIYFIKNTGSNFVYLKPASGDSIDGSPNLILISPGNASKQIQPANSKNYFIH